VRGRPQNDVGLQAIALDVVRQLFQLGFQHRREQLGRGVNVEAS
jgi:hypothetical protein